MKKEELKLEIIEKYGIKIYQDPNYFKFGVDAFCLANFTKKFVKNKVKYIDLCSGSGVVGIITSKLCKITHPIFVEINPYFASINRENLVANAQDGEVICDDLANLPALLTPSSIDFITVNPPYMKKDHGLNTLESRKDLAKIEGEVDFLDKLFKVAFAMIKDQGQLFMVHRVERLVDIFVAARLSKMEPKTIQYIRNQGSKKASLVLIRFVKNARKFLNNLDDYMI